MAKTRGAQYVDRDREAVLVDRRTLKKKKVPWHLGLVWVFQKLIYWDIHTQSSQGFTENGAKKEKISSEQAEYSCSEMRHFWRQKGVQPSTREVYLAKWPLGVYRNHLTHRRFHQIWWGHCFSALWEAPILRWWTRSITSNLPSSQSTGFGSQTGGRRQKGLSIYEKTTG